MPLDSLWELGQPVLNEIGAAGQLRVVSLVQMAKRDAQS